MDFLDKSTEHEAGPSRWRSPLQPSYQPTGGHWGRSFGSRASVSLLKSRGLLCNFSSSFFLNIICDLVMDWYQGRLGVPHPGGHLMFLFFNTHWNKNLPWREHRPKRPRLKTLIHHMLVPQPGWIAEPWGTSVSTLLTGNANSTYSRRESWGFNELIHLKPIQLDKVGDINIVACFHLKSYRIHSHQNWGDHELDGLDGNLSAGNWRQHPEANVEKEWGVALAVTSAPLHTDYLGTSIVNFFRLFWVSKTAYCGPHWTWEPLTCWSQVNKGNWEAWAPHPLVSWSQLLTPFSSVYAKQKERT